MMNFLFNYQKNIKLTIQNSLILQHTLYAP